MDRVPEVDKAQTSGRAHGCGRTPCRQFLQACGAVLLLIHKLSFWEPCLDLGALENQICL